MNVVGFLRRLGEDEDGIEAVEVALAITIFALVAAGGFFAFGGSLVTFFEGTGIGFSEGGIENPLDLPDSDTVPDQEEFSTPCTVQSGDCGLSS